MYSGQQKSATSRLDPDPGPPPVDRPKPWPRAPVSAIAVPGVTCAPLVGVLPRASSGACFTSGAADALVGLAEGFVGSVMSGAFAAGGRIGSRFGFSSGGVATWTGLPPML